MASALRRAYQPARFCAAPPPDVPQQIREWLKRSSFTGGNFRQGFLKLRLDLIVMVDEVLLQRRILGGLSLRRERAALFYSGIHVLESIMRFGQLFPNSCFVDCCCARQHGAQRVFEPAG